MRPLYISRTHLPSLEEYNRYLRRIWKSNWLTNNGAMVQALEKKLCKYWGVKNVVCVDHGTSAIMIALKALGVTKEVFLSPNSFVATASAPAWLGIDLKFVDEYEDYGSPALVTHLYGIPNPTNAHTVIYDASHAFTTKFDGKSVLSFDNVSVVSFSAVKIFQTVEGGAVVTNNDGVAERARWMRNLGLKTRYSFSGIGINCKMNELQAAMGLCSLGYVKRARKKYDKIIRRYNKALGYNHEQVTYYPVWYSSEKSLLRAIKRFEEKGIYPRRYFYPPLNRVFGGERCPVAEDLMSRVLCLPLYYELGERDQDRVIAVAKETL